MTDLEDTARHAAGLDERIARATTQRAALIRAIEELRSARSLTFADDEHDPDGSTASLDQARDVALLAQTEQTLAELTDARSRLDAGTYGRCERCGQPLPRERLIARPTARFCLRCADGGSPRRR